MRTTAVILTIGALLILSACIPQPPPPINSPAFAKRPPLPGQPGYGETIAFIDNGLHYVMPTGGFLVSNTGDLCFKGVITPGVTLETIPQGFWCMSPLAVSRVDAIENNISYINQVRLWCRLATPQCAYRTGLPNMLETNWVANSITTETVPFIHQREAIEYLVYLMGGNLERSQALR